jgi:cell division protein FtsB
MCSYRCEKGEDLMPLAGLETRFATLEDSNKTLAAEVHQLTTLITEVQGLRESEERTRRRLRTIALGLILAIAVAALVVFGATLARVNTLLNSQAESTRGVCMSRNAQTDGLRARFVQLAGQTDDARTRDIYLTFSRELSGSRVDCNRLNR